MTVGNGLIKQLAGQRYQRHMGKTSEQATMFFGIGPPCFNTSGSGCARPLRASRPCDDYRIASTSTPESGSNQVRSAIRKINDSTDRARLMAT